MGYAIAMVQLELVHRTGAGLSPHAESSLGAGYIEEQRDNLGGMHMGEQFEATRARGS
jgi:hypothetical protein